VHLIWATWDRHSLITGRVERAIHAGVRAECAKVGAEAIEVGGIEDHLHLLARIPTTISIADLAKQVKGSTSHLVTHGAAQGDAFKWQGGYGAFSVSRSAVPAVREYIIHQRQHHERNSLEEDLETIWIDVDG
jgi:putative transposase